LELALYRDGAEAMAQPDDAPGFRCPYVRAIAANLKKIATEVTAEWRADGAFGGLWLNPGSENRSFLLQRETSFALLRSLMNGLTRVRDVELARPLGVTQSRRVLPGPLAGAGAPMRFIAARIDGLRSLFVDAGLAEEMMRVTQAAGDDQSASDVEQARFELTFASRRAAELAQTPGLLNDAAQRSQAAPLGFPLKSAHDSVARAAGHLTKLPVGYNASDGD